MLNMISVTSSMTLVKRPRRAAPKVRTGCITCKIRRVKCGEEKPHCIRCTSTGRKCDGYPERTNGYRSEVFSVTQGSGPRHGPPVLQIQGDNVRYLEFYHRCAGPSLSSKFDKDFWSRISLQMAQVEPSIRHALIALGYLNKAETGSLKDARTGLIATSQKPLLFHYNKAVNSLVQRISEPSYCPEVGLAACILFICIEFMRGDYDTAYSHFNSGVRIISALRKSNAPSSTNNFVPGIIEELLIPMFVRMAATAIAYGAPDDILASVYYPADMQERPFTSLLKAQESIHNLRFMALVFMRNTGTKVTRQIPVPDEEWEHQAKLLEIHLSWLRAFEDLEKNTTLSVEDEIAAHSLKSDCYLAYIFTASTTYLSQTAFDQHLDYFKAMVKHSRAILDAKATDASAAAAANFTFDVQVIPHLYLTACRCRCPVTRREAVTLLERNPPREGLWDAQQHAIVARRIIEMEESELDPITGWPVERTRIWGTIVNGNMDANGKFQVYFCVGLWGEGRGSPFLPPDMKVKGPAEARIWPEWFAM